jgi:hypothetical protein
VSAEVQPGEWVLLSEDPEAVLSALERGETDGILPAACGVMDRFGQLMLELGLPAILDTFPDHRKRKWIPAFLFCNVLLHKSLFRLESLSSVGPFLFSSPDAMRALGFNMRQIRGGFYAGSGQRPFNEEALSDFFAICAVSDFMRNQKAVLKALVAKRPEILSDGSVFMDVVDLRIPAGHGGRSETHLDICVLCSSSDGELLPLLWNILPADTKADITQGKLLMDAAIPILGKRVRRLIADRGFISGAWVGKLKSRGIDTVIGLRSDMALHKDMIALSELPETEWLVAEPPKYHKREIPTRHIAYLSDLEMWESCKVELAGIVVRDTYTDKTLYYTVVTTDPTAEPEQIHSWIRSRWDIEEVFMAESRYGCFNRVGACRPTTAAAVAHFSLLTYTLLRLLARQEEAQQQDIRPKLPTAQVEFVAYWQGYYAIIYPSQLVELVARCAPAWGDRLPSILEKLRAVERPP